MGLTGGGDDNVELLAVLALVSCIGGVDAGSPKGALEARHAGWVRTVAAPDRRCSALVGGRIDRRVTLDITRLRISTGFDANGERCAHMLNAVQSSVQSQAAAHFSTS